jgi:hypothetical protein
MLAIRRKIRKEYLALEMDVVVLATQDIVTFSNGNDPNDVTGNDPYDFTEN